MKVFATILAIYVSFVGIAFSDQTDSTVNLLAKISLKNGDTITGRITNDEFVVLTSYAEIFLPVSALKLLELTNNEAQLTTIYNEFFSGQLLTELVNLKVDSKNTVLLNAADVKKITFGNEKTELLEEEKYFYAKLFNNNRFYCDIQSVVMIKTSFGEIGLRSEKIRAIKHNTENNVFVIDATFGKFSGAIINKRIELGHPSGKVISIEPSSIQEISKNSSLVKTFFDSFFEIESVWIMLTMGTVFMIVWFLCSDINIALLLAGISGIVISIFPVFSGFFSNIEPLHSIADKIIGCLPTNMTLIMVISLALILAGTIKLVILQLKSTNNF